MDRGSANRRRLGSRAAIVLVLGLLGLAAFFAVGHLTGGHSAKGTAIKTSPEALARFTVNGKENEIAARDKWFYGQRAFPAKTTPRGALAQAVKQTHALQRSATDRSSTTTWSRVGPNPIATIGPDASSASGEYGGQLPLAGRVSAIAPAPSNSNTVYIGGANGGVWRSADGGATWATAWPTNMASFSIGAIAVSKTNPSDVWVGTGEANGSGDSYYGQGIYHSTNGGSTWTKVGPVGQFDGCFVSSLAIVSSTTVNAGILEFPGVANPACTTAKRGVWRTTNTGSTWTHISLPSSSYQAPNSFSQPPSSPTTIFLGTYIDGIYKSTNGGATWTKTPLSGGYRETVSAYSPTIVYSAISGGSNGGDFAGLYKSINGGSSWGTVAGPSVGSTPCTYPGGGAGGQCWYDITVAADPTNSNRAFVGGIRLFRYTGTTGVPVGYGGTAGKIHVDQHVSVFDSAHNMWEGSDGGAYRLAAAQVGAATPAFTNRNGSGSTALGISEFNGWASGSISGGTFIGGLQDNGTAKYTTAGGLNWRMDHGGDGGASAFVSASTYFASYYGSDVFRTTSGGSTYSDISGAWGGDSANFYPPMVQDAANLATLYRGTNRVWRTTNATTTHTWTAISPVFSGATVNAIGVEKVASPAYVYAGICGSTCQLKYTHNATAATPTWSTGTGLPNRYMTDIWVNPTNHNVAIATLSGFNQDTPTTLGHVFKTTNGGASWTNVTGNLPNVPVNAITADPANANHVFLGTDTGVFYSSAGGSTWSSLNGTTLPNTTVTDIMVDGTKLVAATHGRSAWTATKP
jgi:photosystem II stability/assembly factor-like uncharacterized protein